MAPNLTLRRAALAAVVFLHCTAAGVAGADLPPEPPSFPEAGQAAPDVLAARLVGRAGAWARADVFAHSPTGRSLSQANFWSAPRLNAESGVCEADFLMVRYRFAPSERTRDVVVGPPAISADRVYRAPGASGDCEEVSPTFLTFFRAPSAAVAAAGLAELARLRSEAAARVRCLGSSLCDDAAQVLESLSPTRLAEIKQQRCLSERGVSDQTCFEFVFSPPRPYAERRLIQSRNGDAVFYVRDGGEIYMLPPPPPPPT